MSKTLGTGAAQLNFKFQIGSYRQITFNFGVDISGQTFELFLKRFKGDRLKTISLTIGSGISIPVYADQEIVATFTVSDTQIDEGEYYIELRRTDLGIAIISGLAYFSFDAPDGDDLTPLQFTIGDSTINITISNSSSSSSTGLTFEDFTASDDTYPTGASRGDLFRSLNFAMYNGNGYPADTLFLALEDNPTSAQWKLW